MSAEVTEKLIEYRRLKERYATLLAAAKAALPHVEELEDAWQRGALQECDGQGGTRSNRNHEVGKALRQAVKEVEGE